MTSTDKEMVAPERPVNSNVQAESVLSYELLPSFSTRDLSQLVVSWMGRTESSEYLQALDQSSGLDFQARILQRQTSVTSVSSMTSKSSEVPDALESPSSNNVEPLVVTLPSSLARSVEGQSTILVPLEAGQQKPENRRILELAPTSKRPRFVALNFLIVFFWRTARSGNSRFNFFLLSAWYP